MKNLRWLLPGIFVCLLTGLILVVQAKESNFPLPTEGLSDTHQDIVDINQFDFQEYQGGKVVRRLIATNVKYYNQDQKVQMTGLQLLSTDTVRGVEKVRAENGRFDVRPQTAELWGNITYSSGASGELYCSKLSWDMKNKKLIIPGDFMIKRNAMVIKGTNLSTNEDLSVGQMQNIEAIGQ
jgi:LPS export ABC transporter protein LptC